MNAIGDPARVIVDDSAQFPPPLNTVVASHMSNYDLEHEAHRLRHKTRLQRRELRRLNKVVVVYGLRYRAARAAIPLGWDWPSSTLGAIVASFVWFMVTVVPWSQ